LVFEQWSGSILQTRAKTIKQHMKIKLLLLLLPVFLLSCSRKPSAQQTSAEQNASEKPAAQNTAAPSPSCFPYNVSIVEPSQTKEINSIKQQVLSLLAARDYNGLDALAKKFRDSKECYADGYWKLSYVYYAFDLPDDASDADWTARFQALHDWIDNDPDSITPRVAMADQMVSFAWKARGIGYANEIPQSHVQAFFQRLNEAVQILEAAKKLKEQCPKWWSVMMSAELGLQVDRAQYDATFHGAITAWPDYTPLYVNRAYYLLPRWYGAEGEWEKDLADNADRMGGDDGDMLYARVVWAMHGYQGNIFKRYKLSWPRVNTGFEAIEKRYPDSLSIKNAAANLASLALDTQSARKYFDQTQGQVDTNCWDSLNEYVGFANWAYGCNNQ
jgi:hypothetical protein